MNGRLVEIKSEYIYESIICESEQNYLGLIKTTTKFIKNSKNEITKKMKQNKSQINNSNLIIEFEDFTEFISIFKEFLSKSKKYDNLNELVETWRKEKLDPLLYKQQAGGNKKSAKISVALKTLEKSLHEIDKIFIELNPILASKKNVKNNNTMEITSTIRHISDQITGEMLLCINKISGINVPKNIKPIDVKLIHNDLNSARERIAYMILAKDNYTIDDINYIITLAKNKYKKELYQLDKRVNNQDLIYTLNSDKIDIDNIFKIRAVLSNNFSEKKVGFIIDKNFN